MDKESFFKNVAEGYFTAALWTEQIDGDYGTEDIYWGDKENQYREIKDFMDRCPNEIYGLEPGGVGHDIWLTRNGHGAGFWDKGYGELGEELTRLCENMGFITCQEEGGRIYFE